jgi:hypothetical protein
MIKPMDRKTPSDAQAILDSLLMNVPGRTAILAFYCESIIHAHEVNPSGWGVTLHRDRIRLNVGQLSAATIHRN